MSLYPERDARTQALHIALKAADVIGLGDLSLIEASGAIADFIIDGTVPPTFRAEDEADEELTEFCAFTDYAVEVTGCGYLDYQGGTNLREAHEISGFLNEDDAICSAESARERYRNAGCPEAAELVRVVSR